MEKYHKIITAWKRDPANNHKTLIEGEWATPELGYLHGLDWMWTEKVDGTNIRVCWDGEVVFGGRTERAQIPATLINRLNELFPQEKFSALYPDCPMVLYGEGYGAGVQNGGGYMSDGVDFILFDVRIGDFWLKREDVEDVAIKLRTGVAPVVGVGSLVRAIEFAREGFASWLPGARRAAEGLVMRPLVELQTRAGGRVITKIKSKDFVQ